MLLFNDSERLLKKLKSELINLKTQTAIPISGNKEEV